MRVTFFNSAFVTVPAKLIHKGQEGRLDLRVRFAVIEHPTHGPVLIDGGYGREIFEGTTWALRAYTKTIKPRLVISPEEALNALGYERKKVRKVLVSHLHAGQICGLGRFPGADLIMSKACADMLHRSQNQDCVRHGVFSDLVRPLSPYVRTTSSLSLVSVASLGVARDVFGDGTVLAVDLDGHAPGHTGFLFPTVGNGLFYAVDAAWTMNELRSVRPEARLSAWISASPPLAELTRGRVSAWARSERVVLCHDPEVNEFDWNGTA